MTKKLKGSLTVFFALIMVSVMTLMFTMAECIRIYELHDFSQEYLEMSVESAFSEYNSYLWKNYRILALDLGYGTEVTDPSIMAQKIMDYCSYNANPNEGANFARLKPVYCDVDKYALLTDNSGQGVMELGVQAAKDNMAAQIVDEFQSLTDGFSNIESVPVEKQAQGGKTTLEDVKKANAEAKANAASDDDPNTNPSDYPEPEEVEDNPLDAFSVMREMASKGVLATVISTENLSDKSVMINDLPSHRRNNVGNMDMSSSENMVDKALFVDYLLTNYSYYGNEQEGGFKYELEYLIAGRESDAQNLARTVEEMLLIRECANYYTITQSDVMKGEAKAIAAVIAGFTLNPAIVDLVQKAIMAAWAYIESVLDVRLLLAGGRLPLVKNSDQWTSDVAHLSSVLDVNSKAKECEKGITYKDYLIGFLALNKSTTLSMRACDVMEIALNSTEDYKNVKMDNMVFAADISVTYEGEEMFLSLLGTYGIEDGYEIKKQKQFTYM